MVKFSSITLLLIRKYIFVLLGIFVILSFVMGTNLIAIGKSYSNHLLKQMDYNLFEYREVDLEQLCRISNCNYVLVGDINSEVKFAVYETIIRGTTFSIKLRSSSEYVELFNLFDHIYFSIKYGILLRNDIADSFFALNLSMLMNELLITYMFTFLGVYLITIVFLVVIYKRSEEEHILQTLGSEAILSNQSMILIAENVHHELNTPLEVIDNKVEKVHRIISNYLISIDKHEEIDKETLTDLTKSLIKTNADFEFIKQASEQIYTVLEKMKGFKHLRYSNGNKTLYDICIGSLKTLSISNSGFDYSVDNELDNYKIRCVRDKILKNVDLVNVVINHIKNSLEAKSTRVEINFGGFKDNKLHILIVDNGNGIPKPVLDKIFLPNFSTKEENGAVRGNGMYLNKFILESTGGSVQILDSTSNGTIIELIIPATFEENTTVHYNEA